MDATRLNVTGMTCGHCRKAVEEALAAVPGASEVRVDLERGVALVGGTPEVRAPIGAVEAEGDGASAAG